MYLIASKILHLILKRWTSHENDSIALLNDIFDFIDDKAFN
jgi:hypothetical protein